MSEPRPTKLTPELALRAATKIAEDLAKGGHIEPTDVEAHAADIAKHGRLSGDGYELAKSLDDDAYWNCNFEMAETLDAFSFQAHQEIEAAEKAWAERNNVQPPLSIGTRVSFGRDKEVGTITGVYEHSAAKFLIAADGEPENTKRVVRFEDANPLA